MAEEDIIFGKNRHFFGGIEPSHVPSLEVVNSGGHVMIRGSFPDDTIVGGQMLCNVSGIEIRRGSVYPKDEFDGDLVVKLDAPIGGTKSFVVVDENAKADRSYFYSAFPYSSQGVYNRSTANHYAYNEPSPLSAFTAKSVYDSASDSVSVVLDWELPSGLTGVVICKSDITTPTDPTVGVITDMTASGTYTDSDVTIDTTYYYRAFPYVLFDDDTRGYCWQEDGHASTVTARKYAYLYGYDIDLSDSDPDTRVSYPSDVDNAKFTPAYMDFTAGAFNYGSWTLASGEHFMPKPCMLTSGGTVDHYLDPNDYTKREDGTTSSSIADSNFKGNAMMEWGKIYTKRWEENGVYKFRCSDIPHDDSWVCWCNYDANNNEIDNFYTAIYRGYTTNNTTRSRSNVGVTREKTMNTERTCAKNNGTGWDLEVFSDHLLIQDLLVLMSKSTNTQDAYGVGRGSSSFVSTGSTNTSGLFSGASDASASVKVFGMEDWWGDLSRRILGLTVYNGVVYAKITKGTRDGSTVSDYAIDSVTGYINCGSFGSATVYGCISRMSTNPWGRLPLGEYAGSATTYECDFAYLMYSTHSYYPAEIGGSYNITSDSKGAFMYYFDRTAASESGWFTSRLSYKPTAV